ncbi:MAG: EcsC family protein [Chitinophagaceae bacterium]|nr:EcsC family protein [Oligoflexus sp.]
MALTDKEEEFINEAAAFLEHPSLVLKLSKIMGKPLDMLQSQLPEKAQVFLTRTVEKSLQTALKMAVSTIKKSPKDISNWTHVAHNAKVQGWAHTAGVAASGAIGGFFGLASLPLELPLSTAMILRGISSVATEWGQDINDPIVQMQCIYVFSLGTSNLGEDSSYLSSRIAFGKIMSEAAAYVGQYTAREIFSAIEKGTSSVITRFIAQVAARFEVAVTEKLLAGAIPIAGAVGGAAINAAFCDYYVRAARYHFGLLHLESLHGTPSVQKAFKLASVRA